MKKLFTLLFAICVIQYATAQSCADGVSYNYADMLAIFDANGCNMATCHGGTPGASGFNLMTYAGYTSAANGCQGANFITKIDGSAAPACGGSPMPLGGGTMSAADITAVTAWVNAGEQEFCPTPPPPPANDLCADAIPLTVDATETCVPTAVSNMDATDSAEAAPTCANYAGGDVWYSVTVPASGVVSVETNNDGSGTITDSGMSLYSGTCGALTEIECDDDDSPDGLFSLVELTGQTPGDVIYVRVWEWGNDVPGTFSVCAYEPAPPPPPPANDMCADAIVLPVNADLACGTVTNATIESATDSGLDVPPEDNAVCTGTEDDDIWFSFVATNDIHQIDLTNVTGSTTDLYHSVWEGSCGTLTNIICSDPNTSTLTGLTPGNTYYVRVYTWTATVGQDSVFDVCVGTPPPPPPGDECADPIPYPGDVVAGTCVTGFDFTIFSDNGNPSPSCDFGGDAVAWFSWTAPIITAAGDPIDLTFDDGDGQATDCNIGIEAYEVDCTTPASNCLGNVSGSLTGLIQGTDYVLLAYQDTPASASCDFCLSVACSPPEVVAFTQCQTGTEDSYLVIINVTNFGVGNSAYTVDVGGMPQGNITGAGSATYGPFPAGTPVDLVITGVDDPSCGFTATGLIKDCSCPPDLALSGPVGPYCTSDAAVPITYAPVGPFLSSVSIEFLTGGTFDTEISLGLYPGTFDDGSVIGLPPAGTGLLGTADETDIENSVPGANDLNAAELYTPAPVGAPIVLSNLPAGDYTIYLGDDFGDGWNGATLLVTDECGNLITTEAPIEDANPNPQDELAWVNFTIPLQAPFVTVSGNGVVQTSDPDGIADSGDETYEFDPSQVAVTGCDPVTETLTLTNYVCDVICETTIDVQVFPPAQAPTITRDDDVCNYTITEACTGDVLDVTGATVAPGVDPAVITVNVITANNCTGSFMVDPELCPAPGCTASASTIATTDPTRICIDGVGDPIDVSVDVDGGFTGTWIITDAAGMILALPPSPPFDLDGAGAGQCLIWYANSDDAAFNPMVGDDAAAAVAASSCAFLSNPITVDRIEVTAPAISTTDPTTICIDGVGDPINVTTDDAGIGAMSAWVITDAAGMILALPPGPPFDLDGAGAGQCLIWLVNYEDPTFAPAVGDDAAAIVAAATCAVLSNPITVDRIEVTAPAISTTDPTIICADDGIDDLITPTVDDAGTGAMTAWVITDAAGTILALPPAPPFNLEGAGGGTCLIWLVNYEDPAFAPAVGDDAAAIVAAATCAVLSNSIAVTRNIDCGMCEEEITYSVSAPDCDMTGAFIELMEDSGTSLGSMALGVDGGSGTFGIQPCGDYTFTITGAPACYTDAGGDIGPRTFTTDGTGTANNQSFNSAVANIPTVGEWGLIILGLLMSITAVVGIRQRREEEVYS